MRSTAALLVAAALAVLPWVARAETAPSRPLERLAPGSPRIVNGLPTTSFPTVVALLDTTSRASFCSGTLVGCRTVLTAAHCVCEDDGPDCQGSNPPSRTDPGDIRIFLQHAGLFTVTSVAVHPSYEFGTRSDVAVLTLGEQVEGIAPTRINTTSRPASGSSGTIAGFGLTRGDLDDSGIKRQGMVSTSACTVVPNSAHVCWQFANPLGGAGLDSNTCSGDSGGPLFVNLGAGNVVAGVTSGGTSANCLTPDSSWDADVFVERAWIQSTAGSDLNNTTCGTLPQVGQANTSVLSGEGALSGAAPEQRFSFSVPANTERLRVTLNGEDGSFVNPNDFELYVRAGNQPTTQVFDCGATAAGAFEECEFAAPAAGTWHLLARRQAGSGNFQVTSTLFAGESAGSGCVADDDTLCIDDQPGDQRWKIEVSYETTLGGGRSGMGQAIPLDSLGISRGGLFWFFNATNPELLIKVLNSCNGSGFYWVFWSAGTSVGMTITVTDTETGRTKTYTNPDRTPAAPVTDTRAFTCP